MRVVCPSGETPSESEGYLIRKAAQRLSLEQVRRVEGMDAGVK